MIPVARACLFALSVGWASPFATAQTGPDDEPPANLVAWKIANFSPEELRDGTSDDSRDLRHDGLPNLLRYALGLSPRDPAGTPVLLEQVGNQIVVHYRNGTTKDDVSCRLEFSTDLEQWSPAVDLPTTPVSDQPSPLAHIVIDGSAPEQPRFFRLAAERTTYDRDEDSLEDDSELTWFATIVHGPADDPDQDGVTTADELTVGRSPQYGIIPDQAQALRATGLEIFTPSQ
jgi:hypothetical protein